MSITVPKVKEGSFLWNMYRLVVPSELWVCLAGSMEQPLLVSDLLDLHEQRQSLL